MEGSKLTWWFQIKCFWDILDWFLKVPIKYRIDVETNWEIEYEYLESDPEAEMNIKLKIRHRKRTSLETWDGE